MSLTDDDKKRIQNSLNKFTANAVDNMPLFYEDLLIAYPQYKKRFFRLKNVEPTEVHNNEWIRNTQAPKVGAAVVDLVGSMEDGERLKKNIHDLVFMKPHTTLVAEDYLNTFKSLVNTMKKCLGDELSQDDIEAWLKLAGVLVPMIDAEVKMLGK